jgi:hypothetical protein
MSAQHREPSAREFVLLVPPAAAGAGGNLQVLPVPDGPSFLIIGRRGGPRLVGPERRRPPRNAAAITLEPVQVQRRPYLLMLGRGAGVRHNSRHALRHNGQPAWPVTLLRAQDEVSIDGQTLYISAQRGQSVFPPAAHHLGRKCPLCTLAIEKDTLLCACAFCATVLHCEDERWPEEKRLECGRLAGSCPKCQQPLDFREGLEWEPEL